MYRRWPSAGQAGIAADLPTDAHVGVNWKLLVEVQHQPLPLEEMPPDPANWHA